MVKQAHQCQQWLFRVACGVLVGTLIAGLPALAVIKTGSVRHVATPRAAAKPAPLPPGMVSKAEALRKIQALQATLDARWSEMSQKYDKQVYQTLEEAFKRNNTAQQAMQYVDAWSSNGLYVTWHYDIQRFYQHHQEALKASVETINKGGYARASDLAYLEQGMAAWKKKEQAVAALMDEYLQHMAKSGYFSGEAMKITSDPCYFSSSCPGFQDAHAPQVERFRAMAQEAGKMQTNSKQQAAEAAKTKLFSAISEVARIPLPEEKIKRLPAQ